MSGLRYGRRDDLSHLRRQAAKDTRAEVRDLAAWEARQRVAVCDEEPYPIASPNEPQENRY